MIDVRRYGDAGPLVYVLHGGPGAPGYMAPVARELAERGFRVLEPLQRPSGGEPLTVENHISDLREAVDAHGEGAPAALVGSSWGAMLALAFAAAHPDLVASIVLVGSGTFDQPARERFQALCQARLSPETRRRSDQLKQAADTDAALAEAAALELSAYGYDMTTTDLEMVAVDARANTETMADWHRLVDEGVYPASFAAITSPVLMLHGDYDPHPGNMIRDSLRPYLPKLEYIELQRGGHYPWFERHARVPFFEALERWLRNGV